MVFRLTSVLSDDEQPIPRSRIAFECPTCPDGKDEPLTKSTFTPKSSTETSTNAMDKNTIFISFSEL